MRISDWSSDVCSSDLRAAALLAAGRHDVLAAPLVRDGQAVGALVSYDRTGFVEADEGEAAVMAALAEVAVRAMEKSELLGVIVEERRRLAEDRKSTRLNSSH